MPKQLMFHADRCAVTVCVNGHPVALHGEVDVVVKEPVKKTAAERIGWGLVDKKNASSVSVDQVPSGGGDEV